MQLTDYLAALRRSWLLVLACGAIGAASGTILALLSPTVFQASTSLYVSVRNTGAATDLAQSTAYARQAVTSFVHVIPTAIVLDPVNTELALDVPISDLADQISASAPVNAQTMEIAVDDQDPSRAAQIANAVAHSFATVVSTELERPTGTDVDSKVRVEVTSPARVPTEPSSPNTGLSITLGLLVGLAVGLGLAVLRSMLDTRVRSVADVEETVSVPTLGTIAFDPDAATRPLVVQAVPRDPRSEAFRRLRTNLRFVDRGSGTVPVFVITSAAPAEGKSTTAANTALAIAETGARVALVDADLRKPRLAANFAVEGGAGLSDVLVGRARLSDVVQQWGLAKLFLLPAGPIPPNPAELLGSAAMARTLAELRAAFDVVVIDAPPLLAVTDAALVARQATGAILVVASGSTRKPQVIDALKTLETIGAPVLGTVLTKIPTSGVDGYGYGYYARPSAGHSSASVPV
ncbi:polysaccharide biosynthesis tyrosine autokinase [Microbacterium sp.]|uniref:polysaccharide biosynthesis tyrosine autokinase n=1 Tax=Microbacterium sp. TaxID=51671 RepID=UPI003C70A4C6